MTELAAPQRNREVNPEQLEVLDHPDSLCLSAGAGSGKTRTLVEKYLQLLIDEGRDPGEILAITFTEKAAAEMQSRIRAALQSVIHAETDPARCGELEEKLMSLGAGWISTIHSFGARILREHPAEAGVDPGFTPLPEQESQMLWESAAVAAVLELVEQDPMVGELTLRMGLHSGGRGSSLVAVLLSVRHQLDALGHRPEDIRIEDPPMGRTIDPAGLLQALDELVRLETPGAAMTKRIPAFRDLAARLAERPIGAEEVLRALAKSGWDEKEGRLKPGGALKKNEKELFAAVESAGRDLATRAAQVAEVGFTATLTRLLAAMWRHAEREKTRRRALDFSDLEIKTLRLLELHPEATQSYRDRFKHILVDEYQDVNFVQARIVRILAGDRPRSLFAVGDPKQSIYRFRGADVEQFQNLWKEMEERQAAFQLKCNYRSHPKLVEAVNAFFDGRIFCGNPPVNMTPARTNPTNRTPPTDEKADRARIRWVAFDLGDSNATERRELEAQVLADRIRRMTVEENFAYGDFALLFRATSSLYLYEEAMRRARIPYELVKSGTAFRSQEVLDLLNALTVTIDPSDKISWLGFLRSPLAGLSDDGIWMLARQGDLRNYFIGRNGKSLPEELGPADRMAAEKSAELVQRARSIERKTRAPLSLLDWIIRETGYLAILTGLPQPDARRRYVETLRSAAIQYSRHRPDPHIAFLEAAWRMVDQNERESGMDAPAENRVKLMTIHQAKGLEFPVVILPDLLRSDPARSPDFYVTAASTDHRTPTLAARIKLAGIAEKFTTPRWQSAKEHAEESERDEQKRLLYVAMTRAQDLLILPGPDEQSGQGRGGSVWEMLYEFLKEERDHVELVSIPAPDGPAPQPSPDSLSDRISTIQINAPDEPPKSMGPAILSATAVTRAEDAGHGRPAVKTAAAPDPFAVSLGTLAHEVLEHIDLSLPADQQTGQMGTYLDERLRWISVPPKRIEPLKRNLESFFRSDLAARLRDRRAVVRREYPFTLALRSEQLARPVYLRGKLDLLILGEEGIEIYDYKYTEATDEFGEYEGQLLAYALAACAAFGADRVTVGLQFLTGKQRLIKDSINRRAAEQKLTDLILRMPSL